MWGQLTTCPDLSFLVSLLAHFQANSRIEHWKALMHVIGYIKNTLNYGLTYSHDSDLSPHAYVDANYRGCKDTCHSTSRHVFIMGGEPVSWSSKWKATVTLSTVEAEYVAMSRCTQQIVWMQSWLDEVEVKYPIPGLIRGDNQGTIALTKNTRDHGKVKHINIQHHYICKLIQSGTIMIEQVSSSDNLADLFTKSLPHDHCYKFFSSTTCRTCVYLLFFIYDLHAFTTRQTCLFPHVYLAFYLMLYMCSPQGQHIPLSI